MKVSVVPDLLRNAAHQIHHLDHPFLSFKEANRWVQVSYRETFAKADAMSSFLLIHQIAHADKIAFITENCPNYIYLDQALQQIGAINVSIYHTLSDSDVAYIINDSLSKIVFVGSPFLLRKILRIAPECPSLKLIITNFEEYAQYVSDYKNEIKVVSFSEAIDIGEETLKSNKSILEQRYVAIQPSDISAFIYTSGTTGVPKGVMLSHDNFVQNTKAALEQIPLVVETDIFLSFLPLSHVFERTATYLISATKGCQIAFAQSLELLPKNMEEVKPTVINCVPRLLERIYDKAMKAGTEGGGLKKQIFLWAISVGKKYRETQEAGIRPGFLLQWQRDIADKLVFDKIRQKTGGRLKFMISGGAALPKSVGEFFGNLGIKVLEGFGLTETSPIVAVTETHRQIYGTVGRVVPGIEIGIQNPETLEIYAIQTHETFNPNFVCPEGEIIIRGHCVMQGYWNKPYETAQVIDKDKWFHTGDIGRFYKGNLQITDRIKNMLVNAYGKNIYPTPIENTYLRSPKIEQIFVIGDKREYITAIVVPSQDELKAKFNLETSFFAQEEIFIKDDNIRNWINEDIAQLGAQLSKYEQVKKILIKRNPFSIEEGEITPTLKAKRKVIETKYAEYIDQLYKVN